MTSFDEQQFYELILSVRSSDAIMFPLLNNDSGL